MGALKNRCTVARPSFYLMLPAMLSGVQHWTQKVPELRYFQKYLDSPPILCHNQRDKFTFHLINIIYSCFFSAQIKTLTKQLSKIK